MFTGSGVALVTPFHDDGTIDYDAYEKLIEFQIENGTQAIITCGTTGEASTLSDDEQLEVIRFCAAIVDNRVPVIAGTGSNDTKHAIHLSVEAEKNDADGIMLVSPYYNKTTQKGLIEHFKAIMQKVHCPAIIYNVPARTGMNIAPQTFLELSKIDNIVAIKEASGNLDQILSVAELCHGKLDIFSGNDDNTIPILSLGGKGVISVVANCIPKQMNDLVMKYLDGDTKGAFDIHQKYIEFMRLSMCETNPIPIKTALNMMGFEVGGFRMPLCEMDESNKAKLALCMTKLGLIE
jgi:4-hydroxy-tetrahydrodipicolinate synthase